MDGHGHFLVDGVKIRTFTPTYSHISLEVFYVFASIVHAVMGENWLNVSISIFSFFPGWFISEYTAPESDYRPCCRYRQHDLAAFVFGRGVEMWDFVAPKCKQVKLLVLPLESSAAWCPAFRQKNPEKRCDKKIRRKNNKKTESWKEKEEKVCKVTPHRPMTSPVRRMSIPRRAGAAPPSSSWS